MLTGEGPNLKLCKKLIAKLKNKKLIYGGGVKNIANDSEAYFLS